jgi:hypothetical protein
MTVPLIFCVITGLISAIVRWRLQRRWITERTMTSYSPLDLLLAFALGWLIVPIWTMQEGIEGFGRIASAMNRPGAAMTPSASPLPPTSPDGASASCACPACHGGPVIACRVCGRGMAAYLASGASCGPLASGGRALCRACGSGQLTQSDTSDHLGVVRCDACGLVQTA